MLKPKLLPFHVDKLFTLLCVKLGNNLASNLFPSLGSILRPNLVQNLVSFLCPILVQTRRRKLPGGQSLLHGVDGKTVVLTIPDHYI
jgi:hypothetical protein